MTLTVRDAGPEDAPAILLIHGWSQGGLSFLSQFEGDLAKDFRIVAPDLRGHGDSDKPTNRSAYTLNHLWGDDIASVIHALGLDRPVLVGWSMGGKVLGDYLNAYGDDDIAGAMLVCSPIHVPAPLAKARSPEAKAEGAYSTDAFVALPAIINFLMACTHTPMMPGTLAFMTGLNMQASPLARELSRNRLPDYRPTFAAMNRPLSVLYGKTDAIVSEAVVTTYLAALPKAQVIAYDDCGHCPFLEMPSRFDADLSAFATQARGLLDTDTADRSTA